MSALEGAGRELVLAFADDELCIGHRHSEWMGVAPFLEEDLAFVSIAQDELSHAAALYGIVIGDDDPAAIDALALGRAPGEYRSCWLAEHPTREWSDALVRHLLYDLAEALRWEALVDSSHHGLSELARRAVREETYHRRHATELFERMARGTDESRRRLERSLAELLPLAPGLWEPISGEDDLVEVGLVTARSADLGARHAHLLAELAGVAGVDAALGAGGDEPGGRRGVRSPWFEELHRELTMVYALDPTAAW